MNYDIRIKNGSFTMLYVTNDVEQNLSFYSSLDGLPDGNSDTVLAVDFSLSIEDTVSVSIWGPGTTKYIHVKKRETGSLAWIDVGDILCSDGFLFVDDLCRNRVTYEYSLTPIYGSGESGEPIIVKITSEFGGVHIIDPDGEKISTIYDVVITSAINSPSSPTATVGKKYPYVIQSHNNQYYSGNTSATYIQLDEYERPKSNNWQYIDSIMKFLSNKKTKVMKDELGRMLLIKIVGTPSVSNSEHQDKAMIAFDWIEVGDASSEDVLRDEGFYGGW